MKLVLRLTWFMVWTSALIVAFFGGIAQLALGPGDNLWTVLWFGGLCAVLLWSGVWIVLGYALVADWRDERRVAEAAVGPGEEAAQ